MIFGPQGQMGVSMNRTMRFSLLALLCWSASLVLAQNSNSQSLGDYARAVKKTKTAASTPQHKNVYDNDNLPANSSISVVGNPTSPTQDTRDTPSANAGTSEDQPAAGDDNKDEKRDPELKAGQSQEDRKKALDSWKEKLAAQNEKVSALAHEVELLQREYTVKSAEFYSNAANMAQNPKGFAQDDADFKQKIAAKQKELDAAKTKLSDLQDEARRAGAPASTADQN